MSISEEIKDAIISEMEEELTEREYNYTRSALEKIVNTSFERKEKLFDLFSKHPLWNPEKLMIQFDSDMVRKICTDQIYAFVGWLRREAKIEYDYWAPISQQSRECKITYFINGIKTQFFNEDEDMQNRIDEVNELNENFKLRINMKSSKAIGKICREEGWDKLEGYNQEYTKLCDCLNPIKVTRHTCISLNPLDYLLMSNGNSWHSCHDIARSYNAGCYSSGTISYMLDPHSFVFYTVDASYDGNQIEREPKIQRQMFGYNDEVIAQLRLYPQDNDTGAEQVYDDIRAIVQKVVADCLGKPNLWIKSKNDVRDVCHHGRYATCYPDWELGNPGSNHCTLSTLKDRENGKEDREIIFGAEPICIECGNLHSTDENISCCEGEYIYCEHCGRRIYEEDAHWVGDYPYCDDCVTYCEHCGEYDLNENVTTEIDGNLICDDCLEYSGDFERCYNCDEWHYREDMIETEEGHYYCDDCAREYTFECDECGCTYEITDENYLHYDEETNCDYCTNCYEWLMEEREAEKAAKAKEADEADETELCFDDTLVKITIGDKTVTQKVKDLRVKVSAM